METDLAVKIFKRSKDFFNVFYGNYIGDGDSKTYTNVVDSKPYGNTFLINKLECVLHVGKRMFRRLIEVKADYSFRKGKKKKEQQNKVVTRKEIEKTARKKGPKIKTRHGRVSGFA